MYQQQQTATAVYIESLKTQPLPNTDELVRLCYAMHKLQIERDAAEFLWMSTTFEDVGDSICKATRCLANDQTYWAFDSRAH